MCVCVCPLRMEATGSIRSLRAGITDVWECSLGCEIPALVLMSEQLALTSSAPSCSCSSHFQASYSERILWDRDLAQQLRALADPAQDPGQVPALMGWLTVFSNSSSKGPTLLWLPGHTRHQAHTQTKDTPNEQQTVKTNLMFVNFISLHLSPVAFLLNFFPFPYSLYTNLDARVMSHA